MLRFMDGFGHYATAQIPLKWTAVSGGVSIANNGRRASNCVTFSGASYLSKTIDSQGTWIIGFAYKKKDTSQYSFYLKLLDSATEQVQLKFTDTDISVWSNGSQLGSTATNVLTLSQFYYVEAKFIIHGTTGSVTVNVSKTVNGNYAMQQALSTGNCCTQVSSNASANTIKFESEQEIITYIDDVRIFDGTGTYNKDFVGDQRIDTLSPRANGTYSQFSITSPAGVDHYTTLDELIPSTTDFVRDSTEDHKDTYLMKALPSGLASLIYGVQPVAYGDSVLYWKTALRGLGGEDTPPYTTGELPEHPFVINGTNASDEYGFYAFNLTTHLAIGLDLGAPIEIDRLDLRDWLPDHGFRDASHDTLAVYASNDGTNWWWVQTFNGYTGQIVVSGYTMTFNLSSLVTARYFKIVNTEIYSIEGTAPGYTGYKIFQISEMSAYRLSGLSKAGIKFRYRMSSTDYPADTTGTALSSTPTFVSTITEKSPRTGVAWTKAEIDAIEAGFAMIGAPA